MQVPLHHPLHHPTKVSPESAELTLGRGHTLIACGRSSIDRHSATAATRSQLCQADLLLIDGASRSQPDLQTPDICQLICCLPVNLCSNNSVANSNLKPQSTLCKPKVHWWFFLLLKHSSIVAYSQMVSSSTATFCCIN